jgi:hypothetical protein
VSTTSNDESDNTGSQISTPAAAAGTSIGDIFDNLENIRSSQDAIKRASAKKKILAVSVKTPGNQEWIRVHPEYKLPIWIFQHRDEKEKTTYYVTPDVAAQLEGTTIKGLSHAAVVLAINKMGSVFLWPLKSPTGSARIDAWYESAIDAAKLAELNWVRVVADMTAGSYYALEATASWAEPEWPVETFNQLLRLAFKRSMIDSMDHPVITELSGLS